jgi:hypothetical protein
MGMRYFLWISENRNDEYCAVYRLDNVGTLWRWEEGAWIESCYHSFEELTDDATAMGDKLLEAK